MKLLRMLVVIWLGAPAVWSALGAAAAPAAAEEPGKYLFLVETSTRLAPQSERVALTVADLIERGLGGRMRNGDQFSILPYHEKVDAPGYASKTWEADRSRQTSNLAFLYLKKCRFEKKSRLDRAMSLLQQVILVEKNLTVYLVCSGEDLVTDTPFDQEINAALAGNIGAWRARRAICVIALVAEKGKLTDWAIGAAEPPAPTRLVVRREVAPLPPSKPATNRLASTGATNVVKPPPVAVPVIPPKTNEIVNVTPLQPPPMAPKTNGVPNGVAEVTPKPKPPTPQTNQVATVKTNETVVVKPPAVPVTPVPPVAPATNQIVEVKPIPQPPTPPPKTNPLTVAQLPEKPPVPTASSPTTQVAVAEVPKPPPVQPKPEVVVPNPPPPPAVTNVIAPPPPVTTVTQVVVVVSNREPEKVYITSHVGQVTPPTTNPPAAPAVIAIIPEPAPRPYGLMAAGAGMLALAVWLAVVWHRRARPATGPSLITQSMNRDRAKKGK